VFFNTSIQEKNTTANYGEGRVPKNNQASRRYTFGYEANISPYSLFLNFLNVQRFKTKSFVKDIDHISSLLKYG